MRKRFSNSYIHTLLNGGIGYGLGKDKSGMMVRMAYDAFVGSFFNVGIEGTYLIPLQKRGNYRNTVDGIIALHLGVALGR